MSTVRTGLAGMARGLARVIGFACAAALALGLLARPAWAGRSCEDKPASVQAVERGLRLAEQTHHALEAAHARDGTQVVLLARAGQDLRKYGLRYSHVGWAWRTLDGDSPSWRVLHKLNHCGSADAALYVQGLGQFFLDDPWRYEGAWMAPTAQVQDRLLPLLRDRARSVAMHHRPYNLVSYAWGQRYQQSNQWAIETLALALSPDPALQAPTEGRLPQARQAAQAWLRAQGYQPTVLTLGPLTRLGGRVGSANIAFDDHPPGERFSDRIATVTADSVMAWMQRAGLGGAPQALALR